MVTFVYLYMYLGDGPMWPDKIAVADSCRQDWWKHLIYINNFVGVEGVPPEKQVYKQHVTLCLVQFTYILTLTYSKLLKVNHINSVND
ncbi:hypothetical protein DPMN_129001 [Dreissena polymorpha]|uniref:Uncharacterized protein n=1 Tax=Dreissena polymorpha TaxID=45954 RepID=A0A9D4H874_DREPO|nr:hypothetical protein DPMN_129001 [Dreissena polymorpha]